MENISKKPAESMAETLHIVRPNHLNGANRLFGGVLMQWIDETAGIVAKRHARTNVTTASVDNLNFLKGAYQNEMVVIQAKITWVGNSSMEVRVDTFIENIPAGKQICINRAYFVFVALDQDDKPVRVPRLTLETEEEKQEWANALKRIEIRKARKTEGF